MAHSIRVVIAAPHALVRSGLIALINASPNAVEVVGVFSDIESAERALDTLTADVLLMEDALPPSVTMVELFMRLHQRHPEMAILVLSDRLNAGYMQTVFAAGAAGFIYREEPLDTILIPAIEAVQRRFLYSSPQASTLMLSQFTMSARLHLSDADMEVLRLIAAGKSVKQIAVTLKRCSHTIYRHRNRIQSALEAPTHAHIIAAALRKGLIDDK